MYGISFNNKHSWRDFGYTIEERKIGLPAKKKVTVTVPFSNTVYDYSELYGSQSYEQRELTYKFNVINPNYTPEAMQFEKTKILNWLMNSHGKQKLYDDTIPGYYFLAEIESAADLEDDWETGSLTVTFTAYPFMISDKPEGWDIWDDFNFELDLSQQVQFIISGSMQVTLINPGVPDVIPTIKATSAMTIVKDGITYNVPPGESKSSDFVLHSGENVLNISGNGYISFVFYKELI